LLKPEITQKVKLAHSLTAHQDVLANQASSIVNPEQPSSGWVKIASLFGNHRSRTSTVMLGLTVLMGIASIPANYPDTVAAAESAQNIAQVSSNSEISPATSNSYIDQLHGDVSAMQAKYAQSPSVLVAQSLPRTYPPSVANRTDANSLQFSGEASVPIEVAQPRTRNFRPVATAQPYYNDRSGSDYEFDNPEDHLPTNRNGVTSIGFSWPAAGTITSRFGRRWGRMHKGIDIAGPVGTPINAAADGVVVVAGWKSGGYGNLVEIRHSDGTTTRYGHNSQISVSVGQTVRAGQQVARMGSTGRSTGSHLHFEIRPSGGNAVNPIALLPANS
jgi:murein DD-endopeptidase MepM/ murein hydrolase activator NlpD